MRDLAEFLQVNNITVAPRPSGLYYIEIKAGSGAAVKAGEQVTVKYTGRLLSGYVFDSGEFAFVLGTGKVIKGWDEGIALMRRGGQATLIIPSSLAYGAAGMGEIPPYSTLLFDVSLL